MNQESSINNQTKMLSAINTAVDLGALEALRVKYLGRSGVVTEQLKTIGKLPADKRGKAGAEANAVKFKLEQAIKIRRGQLLGQAGEQSDYLDLTAPANVTLGHSHPVNTLIDEAVQLFWQMGFTVADGPEVETEWYNFDALNIAADHPARDMQDTFYLEGSASTGLPRTHTSGVQVRYMESHKPPIRIIAPGKVYRNEDEDATHLWMFHQIEGLVVDKGVSLADLKGTLIAMARGLLGPDTKVRLRPSFFPYTEPSVEMDASCVICKGGANAVGCGTCSGTGWIELGGAGMVHPKVLQNVGIDPDVYSGFAFGFGVERLAAIKHQVPDVREFWRPNLKFLEQF